MLSKIAGLSLLCLTLALPDLVPAGDPPNDGSRPPRRPPPPEAITACEKLALDAPCSFTHNDRADKGSCRRGPGGQGPLACAPDRKGEQDGARGDAPDHPRGQRPPSDGRRIPNE